MVEHPGGKPMAGEDATLRKPDPLTMATLQLCSISYARDIMTIPALVRAMPPLTQGGAWVSMWGPVQSSDQSNLAFVAGYCLIPGGAVASIYVTIRGTNIYLGEDIWGILQQIWQDIDGTSQVPLPWLPQSSPVRIAKGTMDGLHHIIGLTNAKGVSLGDYLTKTLGTPAYSNIKTVVTGHSLGGCLASVVAPWIESIRLVSYKGTIQPITFAAPTAGNNDFATYYSTKFTTALRFQNTLDIIPLALQDLLDVGFIYRSDGLDTPDIVWTGITGMEFWLLYYNMTYMQPAVGTQELTGVFLEVPEWDWYDEALFQHHPATYRGQLLGQPLLGESALPHSTVTLGTEARLAKRIGSLDALKRAVRPGAAG
jgi:triacylglycerol lipase